MFGETLEEGIPAGAKRRLVLAAIAAEVGTMGVARREVLEEVE